MGMPFATAQAPVTLFWSRCGHEVRTLVAEGSEDVVLDTPATPLAENPDYTFGPAETAEDLIARIAKDWTPDLLICWVPEMFPPPREIEHCPIKTVAIVSDWNVYYAQIEHNLARYDIVLTDKLGAQVLRPPGATPRYFFPLYSHQTPVHRKLDVEKDIDVAFVGNLNHAIHVERAQYLEQAAKLSDRYRVLIRSGVYAEDYARLLNRARIVLNYALRREMNLRCFETLACNALLFVEEDNLEVCDALRDGEEVVLYRPDNLVALIEYYLTHPEEAARITRQGHAKAAILAGENRLDTLLNWIAEQPMGGRAFREFPEEVQAHAEIMQYASSLVPSQRAFIDELLEPYARKYYKRPEFLVAAASGVLARIPAAPEEERKALTKDILGWLKQACLRCKDSAVLWFNLAFVCRHSSATPAEVRCLELTLEAHSCDYGGLLLGSFSDPYYAASRRALALGKQRVEMIWAAAATRLAQIWLEREKYEEARDMAVKSIGWMPNIALPYRIRAVAESRLGKLEETARILAEGLPLTAFDADYRMDMVRAWQALGKHDEARELAAESARLFAACWGAEEVAKMFQEASETT